MKMLVWREGGEPVEGEKDGMRKKSCWAPHNLRREGRMYSFEKTV
jgi:hypothetical protein